MITYQEISIPELRPRVVEVDVSEQGSFYYAYNNGQLTKHAEAWQRQNWSAESWPNESWATFLDLPGAKAWGAFEQDQLVGFALYRPNLSAGTAQLAALFISKDYRRRGIAAALTKAVCRQAKNEGHTRLYVSANATESAVNFYLKRGFVPTQKVNAELFALEPEDIHMALPLDGLKT